MHNVEFHIIVLKKLYFYIFVLKRKQTNVVIYLTKLLFLWFFDRQSSQSKYKQYVHFFYHENINTKQ